jgi:hypothetical protein
MRREPRAVKSLVDGPKLFLEALKALFVRLEVCKASNFERQSHSRPSPHRKTRHNTGKAEFQSQLERIPVTFEHILRGARNSGILGG